MLARGIVPDEWKRAVFKMLGKIAHATTVSGFKPIACLRLFYKLFSYLVLGRIEDTLEHAQPEEQHGFRSGRRLEEHVVTANIVFQKTLAVGIPIWFGLVESV